MIDNPDLNICCE